jgi:hypothetical protein
VAPLDQVFPVELEEVKTTEPPAQNVVELPAVMVGVAGKGLTVTTVAVELALQLPFDTETEYDPLCETVMDWVVAPLDQLFPVALEEVKTTEPPAQNVVELPAVIVGVVGSGLTVTTVGVELAVQFPLETFTENDPLCETVMDCVVAPLDQVFPVALEEVKTTEPPAQNVVELPAEIVGVVGSGLTVITVGMELAIQLPLETETEYDPLCETVMDCVVAPFDHVFPVALEEVKTTEPPVQKVVAPPVVIVGVGMGLTITTVGVEVAVQFSFETVTEYDPLCETIMDCVVAPLDQIFPVALEEVKTTEPPAQNVVDPLAVIVGIVGNGLTIITVGAELAVQFPLETVTEYDPL